MFFKRFPRTKFLSRLNALSSRPPRKLYRKVTMVIRSITNPLLLHVRNASLVPTFPLSHVSVNSTRSDACNLCSSIGVRDHVTWPKTEGNEMIESRLRMRREIPNLLFPLLRLWSLIKSKILCHGACYTLTENSKKLTWSLSSISLSIFLYLNFCSTLNTQAKRCSVARRLRDSTTSCPRRLLCSRESMCEDQ
jgi:hypothetical protein